MCQETTLPVLCPRCQPLHGNWRRAGQTQMAPPLTGGFASTATARGGSDGEGGRTSGTRGQQEIPGRGTNTSPMLSTASDTVVLDLKKEASQGVLPPCLGHTWLPPAAVSYGCATTPALAATVSPCCQISLDRGVVTSFSSFPMQKDRAHRPCPM